MQLLADQQARAVVMSSQPLADSTHFTGFGLAQPAQSQAKVYRPVPKHRVTRAQYQDAKGKGQ